MTIEKINQEAILWEKTKDPKYKDLWYKSGKEFADGINNLERRIVSTTSSHEEDDGRNRPNS